MRRYIEFVLGHRALVLGIVGLITLTALGLVASRAVIATSLNKLFLGEMPEYHAYVERVRSFASDQVIIIALEDVGALRAETLDRLERATAVIEESADVARVDSVLSAQNIRWEDGALLVRSYAEEVRREPGRAGELLEDMREDELTSGLLVSPDGRHAAVVVELVPDDDRPAERGPQLLGEFVEAMVAAGFGREKVHTVGFLAVLSESMTQTTYTIQRLFPYVTLVLLGVVFLLFRRLWPVALTMLVSMLGVAWTMGFSVLLDRQIGVLHAIVPPVVLIVGFSDVIHLCSAYLLELAAGHDKDEAVRRSGVDVGRACVYTSATTFVGFVGMSFVPTPAFRQLGIVLGFGVAVSLLLAMTVVPIVFSQMKTPAPWRVGATSKVQAGLDRLLAGVSQLTTHHPWPVIVVFSVAIVGVGIGLSRMTIETRFTERFSDDSQVQKDITFFTEHFAPPHIVDVFVDTGRREGLYDADTFRRLADFQAAIAARPGVDHVTSLVDLVRRMHEALTGDVPDAAPLPTTREGIAQYMLLFEMSGGSGLRRLVDFDRQTALVSVRIADEGVRVARQTGDAILGLAGATLGDRAEVEPSGFVYLLGIWLAEIVYGQGKGLMFTFLIIALMMAWGLRSLRLGLWSMVPNLLPVLALGGYLGLAYDYVDSDTMVLAMLAIGIGVDDTIHFLMRFRTESERCEDDAEAIRRTFDFAGRAIVMTTATLALGFAPFALSSYFSSRIFGTLLPMTLVVALVADLLLVPALARVGLLSFRQRGAAR